MFLRYFVDLTLHNIPEGVLSPYEINKAGYDWLVTYITAPSYKKTKRRTPEQPGFLWVETITGINLLISERDIDLLRLFSRTFATPPPPSSLTKFEEDDDYDEQTYGPIGRVEIYLRGQPQPIITSTFDEPGELATYFMLLDGPDALEMFLEEEGDLIYFIDDDGEEVGLRLDRLVLLVAHPGSLEFELLEDEGDINGDWL